jgi:hypothetical protein
VSPPSSEIETTTSPVQALLPAIRKLSEEWMAVPLAVSNTVTGSLPMFPGPWFDILPVVQVSPPSKVV